MLITKKRAYRGQALPEYALILGLVAAVCYFGLQFFSGSVNDTLTRWGNTIQSSG